jgi:hypothetical protein
MKITKLLLKDGASTQIISVETNQYTVDELLYYINQGSLFLSDMTPAERHHLKNFN